MEIIPSSSASLHGGAAVLGAQLRQGRRSSHLRPIVCDRIAGGDIVITRTSHAWDERRRMWCRQGKTVEWRCCCSLNKFSQVMSAPSLADRNSGRRMAVITNASKSKMWAKEPLVKGRITRRAMHIVKYLRSLEVHEANVVEAVLLDWASSMQPTRRDWLDVLKEFDNTAERSIYFKIAEWGLQQSWFEACARDYTKLIDRYGKAGDVAKAESTLWIMEERGVTADVATYTVLIGAYGRAKMLDRARQMMQEISLASFELDAVAYKAMMIAYGSAGMPQEAEAVLNEMESAGVPGVSDTYLALITAYGRQGQATEAQRIFDRMHWKGFRGDLKAFTALMDAYSRAGDHENASAIFGSLRAAGLKPDDRALAILVNTYGSANMLDKAVEVVADLENAGLKLGPTTLTSLLGWFGKVGLVEEAKQVFEKMRHWRLPVTPTAYANMYAAYALARQLDEADRVWDLMAENGVKLHDSDLRAMVEALLAGDCYGKGQKLCAELQAQGWEPSIEIKAALAQHKELF